MTPQQKGARTRARNKKNAEKTVITSESGKTQVGVPVLEVVEAIKDLTEVTFALNNNLLALERENRGHEPLRITEVPQSVGDAKRSIPGVLELLVNRRDQAYALRAKVERLALHVIYGHPLEVGEGGAGKTPAAAERKSEGPAKDALDEIEVSVRASAQAIEEITTYLLGKS